MRYLASGVAPVRGGTYFSLPPQRKVGKRKRLTPPVLDVCPRAPNGPTLHTPVPWLVLVANASNQRLTRFTHLRFSTPRQTVRRRPGGKLCVGFRAIRAPLRTDSARVPPGRSAISYNATTYIQFATWAAYTVRCRLTGYGYLKRVRR